MRGTSALIAAALCIAPATLHAQEENPPPAPTSAELRSFSDNMHRVEEELYAKIDVVRAVEYFFAALRSEDKTALRRRMMEESLIYIHIRTDPQNPQVITRTIAQHLERWEAGDARVNEVMRYESVLVDGDMAQVWGPYRFLTEGETTHCGFNSISLVKVGERWKVGNTSFSVIPPDQCAIIDAPEAPE